MVSAGASSATALTAKKPHKQQRTIINFLIVVSPFSLRPEGGVSGLAGRTGPAAKLASRAVCQTGTEVIKGNLPAGLPGRLLESLEIFPGRLVVWIEAYRVL